MRQCRECGAALGPTESNCPGCGRQLASFTNVAERPLEEEAVLLADLLTSAGFQPVVAWLDDGGRPHPIPTGKVVTPAGGLFPPVTTPFAVFVPQEEADEAAQVLIDAGRQRISDETSAF